MEPVTATAGIVAAAETGLVAQLVTALAGPAGAMVLLALVLYGVYKIVVIHLLPAHDKQVAKLVDSFSKAIELQSIEHREDRAAFKDGLKEISTEVSKMSVVICNQDAKLEKLHKAVVERDKLAPASRNEELRLF